jgi:hypothetical protein
MSQILLGICIAAAAAAIWDVLVHSRPTYARLELRRRTLLKARALHAAELAALQAYEEVYRDAEAEAEVQARS